MMRKANIAIIILTAIIFFSISAICTQFGQPGIETAADEPVIETGIEGDGQETESQSPEEPAGDAGNGNEYHIAFLEIGISGESTHFEHHVSNILTVAPDGSGRRLIYSDIEAEYELGWIYAISPDSTTISCGFFEGGRGAYGALSIVDIKTGSMDTLVEFDYTQSEPFEMLSSIYEKPAWSNDSSGIAYEIISNPYTDNPRDGGIYLVDVKTKQAGEIMLDVEGASLRSTMFLYPVLFTADDSKLLSIFHTYGPVEEDGPILDSGTRNEKLEAVDIQSGKVDTLIDATELDGGSATLGHINAVLSLDKLVFDVRDISGKNGDIWTSGLDGKNLARLTDTPDLIELHLSVSDMPGSVPRVAYTGIKNGLDTPEEWADGDIYIIDLDGTGNIKITDYGTGAATPVFSPDGRYIAYIHSIYDKNNEYIESRQIEVFDTITGEMTVAVSGSGIFSLAGWVPAD